MSGIRQRVLENMQKFSRAMIGAVLFLPVIGLILALSSVLTNPTLFSETFQKPVFFTKSANY